MFCKLSRSAIASLLFASVATILAITVARYLYIVKPLKYPLIVTYRRVFLATFRIRLSACCPYVTLYVQYWSSDSRIRAICDTTDRIYFAPKVIFYILLSLIFLPNFRILNMSRKQRRRIFRESIFQASTTVTNIQAD